MIVYFRTKKKEGKEIKYEIRRDYDGVFSGFYNTLNLQKHINWDFFFYHLKNLEIIPMNSDDNFNNRGALAEYYLLHNKLRMKMKDFKSVIMHEILHLASSVVTKKCIYSGFQQVDRKSGSIIGIGLNEGYTNLLDKRYFGDYEEKKKDDLRYTYTVTTSIASLIENFVGKENMEQWYFSADLRSLVDYLSEYISRDECITFLVAIDNVYDLVDKGAIKHPVKAAQNYQYIVNFLGRCYMNLYIREYYSGVYGKEELKERLKLVYELMEKRLKFSIMKIPFTKKISRGDFHAYVKYEKNRVLKKCA